MANKYLTILIIILFFFLLFSVFIYSSTYNTYTQNRLLKLEIHEKNRAPSSQKGSDSVTESVYDEIFDSELETSTPTEPIIKPLEINKADNHSSKVVYITIDDGPDPYSTPEYLKVLKENEVKVTFFMIGSRMEKYPELVKQIDSEEHAIGNHSYSHNYYTLYSNPENFKEEVLKAEESVFSIIGKRPKVFRAPGGSTKMNAPEFDNVLSDLGYNLFDWNVSAADTDPRGITKSQVIYNIKHESKGLKRVIVLMHDNSKRKASLEALPQVIEFFKEKGYQFKTLDESSAAMRLKRPTLPSKQDKEVNNSVYQETKNPDVLIFQPTIQNTEPSMSF